MRSAWQNILQKRPVRPTMRGSIYHGRLIFILVIKIIFVVTIARFHRLLDPDRTVCLWFCNSVAERLRLSRYLVLGGSTLLVHCVALFAFLPVKTDLDVLFKRSSWLENPSAHPLRFSVVSIPYLYLHNVFAALPSDTSAHYMLLES